MSKMILSRGFVPFALVAVLHAGGGTALAQNPLPAPWQHADVGDVGIAGDATQGPDGDFFVSGAGSDIWGTADSFHFMYRPLDHDGDVLADAPSQDGKNPFAKIGIMIRQSLDPGSVHVILDVKPDGTVEFMTRSTPGGETTFIAPAPHSGSLRLVRRGGIVTGVVCTFDGACMSIGSAAFPSGPALAGGVVTSHDPTTLNHGMFPAGNLGLFSPPPEWLSGDIGPTGLAGSATLDNGTWTVKGAGADIWGTDDGYHFVGKYVPGDSQVSARVTSEDAAHPFAKAGVIARTLGGSSNQTVVLDIRPNGVIEFMARPTSGGPMQFVAGSAASLPVWLKIDRRGNQFTGLMSTDGHDWQVVGITSVTQDNNTNFQAGLAVTSHDTNALNTSTFDHVLVAGQHFDFEDVGDVGIAGQALFGMDGVSGTQGGGADIWGTADAFSFYYVSLKDDGQILFKVYGLDNTNAFAKVGLMIRDSIDPSAAHVLVDVTPSGLVEVLTRPSAGADTQWIGGVSPAPFPIWLKLTRSGQTFDAFASPDGSTWTHVATASSTTISSDALMGIATTSHVRGTVTATVFDSLRR